MLQHISRMLFYCITLLLTLSWTVHAGPISIYGRSSSFTYQSATSFCTVPGYKQCKALSSPFDSRIFPNATFPPDFCCPASTTCQSADNGSTLICCPQGRNCTVIEAINCDISLQNTTAVPKSVIKTTRLSDKLPKCGDACCPFGYECTEEGFCRVLPSKTTYGVHNANATGTAAPSGAVITSATTLAPPMTTTSHAEASGSIKDKDKDDSDDDDDYPGRAVGLGFALGTLAGVILALALISCLQCFQKGKQKKADDEAAKKGKLYTPALQGGSNDRVMISPRKPHVSNFQQKHRSQTTPVVQNPFSKDYIKPNSDHSSPYERSLTSNATKSDRTSTHSGSTAGKQSPSIASSKVPHRTSSVRSNRSIHREHTREDSNKYNNNAGEGNSGVPKHMGHAVLFRPRSMGVSIDSYDAETWNRSASRRSEQGPPRNSADGGRWRPYSGGNMPPGSNGTTWTDVIDATRGGN
ncbi:hypothetical protein AAP_04961 [Ascosphaera apis ARSEF 7405]|uniref:Mid2 domain-containing protein n=1 Tax=Ascosphaera apis ARSEF 7405 TaxID=392613 RepID=A0A167W4I3_9EURO|nr:hypothetical protein AAP_04961 [Ascosphaera apis ARSEF 7405]